MNVSPKGMPELKATKHGIVVYGETISGGFTWSCLVFSLIDVSVSRGHVLTGLANLPHKMRYLMFL